MLVAKRSQQVMHQVYGVKACWAVLQVVTAQGENGVIEGAFGKSGKFKVQFPNGVSAPAPGSNSLRLTFKKFIFDKNRRHMAQ